MLCSTHLVHCYSFGTSQVEALAISGEGQLVTTESLQAWQSQQAEAGQFLLPFASYQNRQSG
jgi:hypothetical protein